MTAAPTEGEILTLPQMTAIGRPWPSPARFLTPRPPGSIADLRNRIVLRAFADLLLCEVPASSNRSPVIDRMVRDAGAPLGSYWCMAAVMEWAQDAGALVPPASLGIRAGVAPVFAWYHARGLTHTGPPVWGDIVCYEWRTAAGVLEHHTAVIARTDVRVRTIEGNAGLPGAWTRNGEGVESKLLRGSIVKGYITPTYPAAAPPSSGLRP